MARKLTTSHVFFLFAADGWFWVFCFFLHFCLFFFIENFVKSRIQKSFSQTIPPSNFLLLSMYNTSNMQIRFIVFLYSNYFFTFTSQLANQLIVALTLERNRKNVNTKKRLLCACLLSYRIYTIHSKKLNNSVNVGTLEPSCHRPNKNKLLKSWA